ncbi:nuclear transport factor 2 family protein [Streptomyces sp. NBC_00075]|uniref:nuclear transport factor 2 family protein n=1 Tax=Streptomyces sp. NBC_00075 TaxID=2975641 RepID=UPI0032457C07
MSTPSFRRAHLGRPLAAMAVAAATLFTVVPAASAAPASDTAGTSAHHGSKLQTAANKKVVVRFFNQLFNEGDLSAIDTYVRPDLIQHNPAVADRATGLRTFVADLKAQYPESSVSIKRVVAEGDLVAVHSNFILEPGTKGLTVVNILRMQDGRIAETWEVSQQVPDAIPSGNDMFTTVSSPQLPGPDPKASGAESKRIALEFFTAAAINRDLTAPDRYAKDPYYNHSAYVGNGIAATKELFRNLFAESPDVTFNIKRVVAEGDLVVLQYHLKRTADDPGTAFVDIFRVRDGKVVEFWDIIQAVPTTSANDNGMF